MANLLDKANILITPTAYSDGKIHSAKPIKSLSAEKVVNGDFENGSTGWTKDSNWTISGGKANLIGNTTDALTSTDLVLDASKTYKISYNISNYVSGGLAFVIGNISIPSTNGFHQFNYTGQTNFSIKRFGGDSQLSIDNISIKEVIDSDLNFTRGSAGTRVNAQGLVENSQGNSIPRINYKDGVGSWLIEPQSTNLVEYSEDFSDSSWSKSNCTVGSESISSPSGVIGVSSVTNTALFGRISTIKNLTNAVSYSYSFFCKNIDITTPLSIHLNDSGITIGTFTPTSEWVKYVFTWTSSSTITETIAIQDRIGSALGSYMIWGGQLEQSSYASSYIPTNGSVQTRLAETASRSGLGDLIDSTQGVFYAEISALYDNSEDDLRWISLNDNSTSNLVAIYYYKATNTIGVQLRVDNVQVFRDDNIPITSKTDFIKIAFKWKQDDVAVYVNGIKKASSTSVNSFNSGVLNRFGFDGGNQLPSFFGNAKSFAVLPILTDEELECLTTR